VDVPVVKHSEAILEHVLFSICLHHLGVERRRHLELLDICPYLAVPHGRE
jgi:hypothetical protein